MRRSCAWLFTAAVVFAAEPEFTSSGELQRPKNYREWVYLTSGLGMTYGTPDASANAEPRFDNVFVEPSAYRSFVETGRWPEKTMFALEVRQSATKGSINKGGRFQSTFNAVEVAVKDSKRFKDGWGYFGFPGQAVTAKQFGESAGCNACHSTNGAVENTFVQFYPTLIEIARAKGVLKASYKASE